MAFTYHACVLLSISWCPESNLLIKKHEQDGDNLLHALAVTHLLQESDMAARTTLEASTTPSLALAPQILDRFPLMTGLHPRAPFPR